MIYDNDYIMIINLLDVLSLPLMIQTGNWDFRLSVVLLQVTSFGCTAFALLFDDIEPGLSETDRSVFQSFGSAQVAVTNEVYQHLGQPQFYFCPTGSTQRYELSSFWKLF